MSVPTVFFRILALVLCLFAAGEMCRTAALISAETARSESLRLALETAVLETDALESTLSMTPEALRQWAWETCGLVGPEDIVFFDEGAWPPNGQK